MGFAQSNSQDPTPLFMIMQQMSARTVTLTVYLAL